MKTNKSQEKLYKTLKPLVNDFTKLCRQNLKNKTEEEDFCIKFTPEDKQFNIDKYITDNFKKELICSICKSLFKNPYTCYKCNIPFCFLCIKDELIVHSKCPSCFEMIFLDMMQPSNQEHLNILNEPYNCPFTGCLVDINLSYLKDHIVECLFKYKNREYCDKIIHTDNSIDPYMKTYLYDYMLGLSFNKPSVNCIDLTGNVNLAAAKCKKDLTTLSDKYAKTILELQELSKKTNDKLKKLIK
jgi:hypothetical protein